MAAKKTKPLRFAVLIRVSTEKQQQQGESLLTQEKQIVHAVESLGGTITNRYAGQEHATSGYERQQLESLLAAAAKPRKSFDAVMVADASRWSRDNAKSKEGLQIFRDNGIRFFTLTQEQNLFDPNASMFLGISAEIGEYQARQQKLKSVINCIERARRIGAPTSGRKPFGRTWDKENAKWGLDEVKHALIQDVAKRYLAGESLPVLAREYDINHSFLNKTLAESCGDSYKITWDVKDLNISESVTIAIPRLLPDRTIKAIRRKAEANRTYQHGTPKFRYLLQGYVFCEECGFAMTGQANPRQILYYRHRTRARHCHCALDPLPYVRAEQLDEAVIQQLFETFGNPKAVERAIERAIPNLAKIEECRQRMAKLEGDLAKLDRSRNTILSLIAKDKLTEDQAEAQLGDLQAREDNIQNEIERLAATVHRSPTPEGIKETAAEVVKRFTKPRLSARKRVAMRDANTDYESMTWEDKRNLVELVFNGTSLDGRPMGIYVATIDGQEQYRRKQFAFTLRGNAPAGEIEGVTQCASG